MMASLKDLVELYENKDVKIILYDEFEKKDVDGHDYTIYYYNRNSIYLLQSITNVTGTLLSHVKYLSVKHLIDNMKINIVILMPENGEHLKIVLNSPVNIKNIWSE